MTVVLDLPPEVKARVQKMPVKLLALGAVFWFGAASTAQAGVLAQKRLGDVTLAVINGAAFVQVEKELPLQRSPERHGPTRIMRSRTFLASVRAALLNDGSYGSEPKCIPDPGVSFELRQGKRTVEVSVCYQCDMLFVYTKNRNGKIIHTSESGLYEARPQWVRLAKRAFPYDEAIQHLQEVPD